MLKSVTNFLERRLRLKVNAEKSAVARPWERKFLGYSLTANREPRLKVAKESVKRLKGKLREIFRRGRGRNLGKVIGDELTPLLRGWTFVTAGTTPTLPACFVNRRIRNRTYGGVGGRRR